MALLKPVMKPHLYKLNLTWDSARPAFELIDDSAMLSDAQQKPQLLLDHVRATGGPPAKKLLIALIKKPMCAKALWPAGLKWEDVEPQLEAFHLRDEVEAAQRAGFEMYQVDPSALLEKIAGRRPMVLHEVKGKIEGLLWKQDLQWEDVEPALAMCTTDDLRGGLEDIKEFLKALADPDGELTRARRVQVAMLRQSIEAHAWKLDLRWEDVWPALALVTSAEELKQVKEDGGGFLQKLASGATSAARRMRVAKLQPLLAPHAAKLGLSWAETLPAFTLADCAYVHEVRSDGTIVHRETTAKATEFLELLAGGNGPAARQLQLALLKRAMASELNMSWDDALPAFEMIESVAELREAVAKPKYFLSRLQSGIPVQQQSACFLPAFVGRLCLSFIRSTWCGKMRYRRSSSSRRCRRCAPPSSSPTLS